MILRNQGVSRYLSPHRAPSEAEEALSFSPALTIWCWMLLVPQSISLPSPLLRRSISKARYSKQGRALRERQGRDLFKSCPRPAETPLIRPLTPASHNCSRFPRLGAPALTLIPLLSPTPFFSPLHRWKLPGVRWPVAEAEPEDGPLQPPPQEMESISAAPEEGEGRGLWAQVVLAAAPEEPRPLRLQVPQPRGI